MPECACLAPCRGRVYVWGTRARFPGAQLQNPPRPIHAQRPNFQSRGSFCGAACGTQHAVETGLQRLTRVRYGAQAQQ